MSGGVETEMIGESGGGGSVGCPMGQKDLLPPSNKGEISVNQRHNSSQQRNQHNHVPPRGGGGMGQGQGRKNHRRMRRQLQQQNRRNNFNNFNRPKRIRRNTQPAPNNTNEFLMQEHDHLFHLDFENEDWESHHQHHHTSSSAEDLDPRNNAVGAFYSSSEDDQDYLSREFSAIYDTVNAERLSSMTKAELITEYQLLQERVETLERRLKVTVGTGSNSSSACSSTSNTSKPEVVPADTTPSSNNNPLPDSSGGGGGGVSDEVLKLREENEQIKEHNRYLQRLMHRAQGKEGDEDDVMDDAEQGSTDSGGTNSLA